MKKTNVFSIKIRPTILFIFLIVVFISLAMTLGLQYYFSKQMANDTIVNNIQNLSQKTEQRLKNFDDSSNDLISLLELSQGIDKLEDEKNKIHILKN